MPLPGGLPLVHPVAQVRQPQRAPVQARRPRAARATGRRGAPRPDPAPLASAPTGEIAQLVEHTTENRGVPGSIPGLAIVMGPSTGAGAGARKLAACAA